MRIIPLTILTLLLAALALTPRAAAQERTAEQILSDVASAYRDADQLLAEVDFHVTLTQGRWSTSNETDYRLAYQAQPLMLAIEHPMFDLNIAGGTMVMQSDELPGRHLETSIAAPLTLNALQQRLPVISSLPLPSLVLLTSDDPFSTLFGAPVQNQKLLDPDEQGRLRVQLMAGQITAVLTVDPQTNLLTQVRTSQRAQVQPGVWVEQVQTWDYTTMRSGGELPVDLIAANVPADSQSFDTFQALVQSMRGGSNPMAGKPAPMIETRTLDGDAFKLEDVKERVIVLDFWTTWCGPCQMSLPELQKVADWAKQQNKSVAILPVNVEETREEARQYWQQMGLTMPVLMDPHGTIMQAYGGRGFPTTVIVADGKIHSVHSGVSAVPGQYEQMLKNEIDALLAKPAAEQKKAAAE